MDVGSPPAVLYVRPPPGALMPENLEFKPPPTLYTTMKDKAKSAPLRDNMLAALGSWLILTGCIVFPGTFTSLEKSTTLSNNENIRAVQGVIKNKGLLPFAILFCLIGTYLLLRAWRKMRANCVLAIAELYWPGMYQSVVGLLSAVINVYTAQGGHWSPLAILTVAIVGTYMAISVFGLLFCYFRIRKIKTPGDKVVA